MYILSLQEDEDDVGSYDHVSADIKPQKRDSGVDLTEKSSHSKIKNRKSNVNQATTNIGDVQFKSGMIFDLEM